MLSLGLTAFLWLSQSSEPRHRRSRLSCWKVVWKVGVNIPVSSKHQDPRHVGGVFLDFLNQKSAEYRQPQDWLWLTTSESKPPSKSTESWEIINRCFKAVSSRVICYEAKLNNKYSIQFLKRICLWLIDPSKNYHTSSSAEQNKFLQIPNSAKY